MRRIAIVFVLALLGIVTACGSGGGDGGPKSFAVGFTPEEPAPGADSVAMAESAAGGDQVLIDINITDTTGVFGAAFTVAYDTSLATFEDYSSGTLLEQGGQPVYYDVNESQPGLIDVVATRLTQGAPGADANGSTPVIRLRFTVDEVGGNALTFQANTLWDASQPLPQPVSGVSWYGGTIVAN
jgi:hypothetical protein